MSQSLGEKCQQQLIETAIELDSLLFNKPKRTDSLIQTCLQISFELLGMLLGAVLVRWSPVRLSNGASTFMATHKAGRAPRPLLPKIEKQLVPIKNILDETRKKKGKVAVFIVMAHPLTTPGESHLLGELVYQGIQIANFLCPQSKYRLVQAIDPFALDLLSVPMASVYSGIMSLGHIAIDRQPHLRNFVGRKLFEHFHYSKAYFHIENNLVQKGNVVCAALAGGVAHNAKVFYTVREFAQSVFFNSPEKKPKRWFEKKVREILTQQGKESACVMGKLSSEEKSSLLLFLHQEKLDEKKSVELISELEEELALKTPYRQRLFKVLFNRTAGRGVPLLLIPLSFSVPKIKLENPVLVTEYDPATQQTSLIQFLPDGTFTEHRQNSAGFVKQFVRTCLNPA